MAGRKGLKINNENSSIQPKVDESKVFEQRATKAFTRDQDYKQRMNDLAVKFKAMIEDRTLVDNKTILVKEVEGETLQKLIQLASEMNADEAQDEGLGNTALSMLLMKVLLLQRDRINTLEFKLEKLGKAKQDADQG